MLLLILLIFFPEWWLLGLFVVLNALGGFVQAGPFGALVGAGMALVMGWPIVAIRRWMRGRGDKKRDAEIDAELARIRAANSGPGTPNP
jgi:hypothetical protein